MSIQIRDIEAGYVAGVPILKGVGVTVEDRSIVTVLGPNGSGKSTLLKSIMGFVSIWRGEVAVDGELVTRVPPHERTLAHSLGYVPQLDNVFGPLSVHENLEIGGARLSRSERRARTRELLRLYPRLEERSRARADSLSGGERQMLAIARALMTRPRHLLLDEPSAGLSPAAVEQLFGMLAEIREREDVTILVVEQNAAQSLAVSDRGLVMVTGEVALDGDAPTLLDDQRVSELYLGGVPDATAATASRGA